jgi:copper chaperone CopZ
MERLQMEIQGMSCGQCIGAVKRALGELDGVSITSVSVGRAEVAYDAAKADAPTIVAAVKEAGYPARAAAVAS